MNSDYKMYRHVALRIKQIHSFYLIVPFPLYDAYFYTSFHVNRRY